MDFSPAAEPGDFYPRSPRGERHTACSAAERYTAFLSTLPARGATEVAKDETKNKQISIHAPREGSDGLPPDYTSAPMRISIHAPREGSDVGSGTRTPNTKISIHAPREGSDGLRHGGQQDDRRISIHAPREGSDPMRSRLQRRPFRFLSTLPARGATGVAEIIVVLDGFLSTLPARGATDRGGRHQARRAISIHAPREGSDWQSPADALLWEDFYPRSPRGERRIYHAARRLEGEFLSTLPARGATKLE